MTANRRITQAFENAEIIPIDSKSKLVMMSDCHRGTGGGNDSFSKNQNIVFTALCHYYREGFSYIELGDGDELWQNRPGSYQAILAEYANVFDLLSKFHEQGRLYMLFGNHDKVKKNPRFVEKHLYSYYNKRRNKDYPLFPGLVVREGILLAHGETQGKILLLHGHQADFFNDTLWRLSQFLVRYVWRPLELIGVRDPTSAAGNSGHKIVVERKLSRWTQKNRCPMIAGHTHRTMFPPPGETPYFNDGCCVRARFVTAIEIENNCLSLVKWHIDTKSGGVLYVTRTVIDGPTPLKEIFDSQITS